MSNYKITITGYGCDVFISEITKEKFIYIKNNLDKNLGSVNNLSETESKNWYDLNNKKISYIYYSSGNVINITKNGKPLKEIYQFDKNIQCSNNKIDFFDKDKTYIVTDIYKKDIVYGLVFVDTKFDIKKLKINVCDFENDEHTITEITYDGKHLQIIEEGKEIDFYQNFYINGRIQSPKSIYFDKKYVTTDYLDVLKPGMILREHIIGRFQDYEIIDCSDLYNTTIRSLKNNTLDDVILSKYYDEFEIVDPEFLQKIRENKLNRIIN